MQKAILGTLVLGGLNGPLHAQETSNLSNLVVTATRTDIQQNQLATAATVYTRDDIERLQVNTLPELLNRTTGLDVTQNGGPGKVSSVFMRGTNSDHVLVLIDGIKFGSVTVGTTPFEILPIDQIERVEIIRGPQSSLYGSEAVGGVIQIFTRKGKQETTPSITLDTGGGSYDTAKASGSVSGRWHDTWYSLSASHFNTQGFDAHQDFTPDKDGYYNTGLNARLGHRFANNAELEAFYMRSEGRTDVDGFQYKMEFVNQVVGLSGSLDFSDDWRSTLRMGQSRDDGDNFATTPAFNSRFDTTRWNVSWVNELQLMEDHQLVFGSDYRLDEVDSTTRFTKTERYDVGLFGELHSRILDNHFINASLRWDENEAFGDYVTGKFGWRYNWDSGISAFASFGNAFKAPSLNDLFYQDPWGSHGDPNLSPEESTTFEVGLSGHHAWAQWEARAYHTDIENLITWHTSPVTFISAPFQTQKAQIDGVEVEFSQEIFGWYQKLGLQILKPTDRETNLRLPRRADKILTYDLSRSFGPVDVGGNMLARGNSFEQDWLGNRTEVPGFVTVDLRAAYHFNKNWILKAKLNNLLDKQYQLVDTFNTADRNFFVAIHYNN